MKNVVRDKRVWFCLTVYPFLLFVGAWLRASPPAEFIRQHAGLYYLITFFLFAITAIGVAIDLFQRLFSYKVQGRQLQLQEQEKERIRRE